MENIWMYWENHQTKSTPKHIELCLNSIERQKGELVLNIINPKNIDKYLGKLRAEWFQFKNPAHRADYARVRLVNKYGGIWIDSDMIALKPLEPLVKIPAPYDYACRNISTSIGCFAAKPNCELLALIIDAQEKVITDSSGNIAWNDIGNKLLSKYGKTYPHHKWHPRTIETIADGKVSKLLSRVATIDKNLHVDATLFHLCNENTWPLIRAYVKNDHKILHSEMLLSKIFRLALNEKANRSFKEDIEEYIYHIVEIFKNKLK